MQVSDVNIATKSRTYTNLKDGSNTDLLFLKLQHLEQNPDRARRFQEFSEDPDQSEVPQITQ
jgi:hypothetical protein